MIFNQGHNAFSQPSKLPCSHVATFITWLCQFSKTTTGLHQRTLKKTFTTGELEITAALPSHAGRYTCSARNPAGVAHKHMTVTVQGRRAPSIWPDTSSDLLCSWRLLLPGPIPRSFQSLQRFGQWLRRYKWCCTTVLFCPVKFKDFPGRLSLGNERAFRSLQVVTVRPSSAQHWLSS